MNEQEGYSVPERDREEKLLEQDLAHLMVALKQRAWEDIVRLFWQKYGYDLAYFKVKLTLRLEVQTGTREPDVILIEHETDEPLEG